MGSDLHILYQSSDAFAPVTGISILSLLENNKEAESITIHLFANAILENNLEKIKSIIDNYGRTLIVYNINEYIDDIKDMGAVAYAGSYTPYVKWFVGQIVDSSISRILYLDGDVIVDGSLFDLWNTSMENKPLAIAKDCMSSKFKQMLGLNTEQNYYNTGVMLFNLDAWRCGDYCTQYLDHLKNKHSDYPYVEQDVVNIIYNKDIATLDLRYNFISLYSVFSIEDIYNIYHLNPQLFYSKECYQAAKQQPIIIHYPTVFLGRPWQSNNSNPLSYKYEVYKSLSPWNEEKTQLAEGSRMMRIQKKMFDILPRQLYIIIHRMAAQYNLFRIKKEFHF